MSASFESRDMKAWVAGYSAAQRDAKRARGRK